MHEVVGAQQDEAIIPPIPPIPPIIPLALQAYKKPPNSTETLSFLSPTSQQISGEGVGGARAAEGAAGARGKTVIGCKVWFVTKVVEEKLPGLRVWISRLINLQLSLKISYQ